MKISLWNVKWVVPLTLLIVIQCDVTSAFFGGLFKHRKTINNDAAIFSAVKSAVQRQGEKKISAPPLHNRRHPDSDLPDEFSVFEDSSPETPESTMIETFHPELFAPNYDKAKSKFNPLSELLSALDRMEQTQSQDEESGIEDEESEIEYKNPSSAVEITVSSKPKPKRPSGTLKFNGLKDNNPLEVKPMPDIDYMKSDILSIVEAAKKRKENKNKYFSSVDINKYKPNREISKDSKYSSEGLKPLNLKNERTPLSDMMKSDILSIINRKRNSSNNKESSSSISDFKKMEIKRPYHSSNFEILGKKHFDMDNDVETNAFTKESSADLKKSPLQYLVESQTNKFPSLYSSAERPKDKNDASLQSFLEYQRRRKPFTNLDQLKLKPASKRPSLQSSSYTKNNQRPLLDKPSSKKPSSQSAFKTQKTRRPSVSSMYDALKKKPTLSPFPSEEETLFTPKPSLLSMYKDVINEDTLKELSIRTSDETQETPRPPISLLYDTLVKKPILKRPSLLSSYETEITKTRRPSISSTYDTLKNRPTLKRPSLMSSDITEITRRPSIASMFDNLRKKPTTSNRPSLFPSDGTRHTRRPSFSTTGSRPTLKRPTSLSEYETSAIRRPSLASTMDSIRNRPTRKRFSSQSSSDSDNIRRPANFPRLDKDGRPLRKTTTKTSFPGKDDMKVRVPSRFPAITKKPLTRNTETKDDGSYEVLGLQQSQNKKKVYVTCVLFVCMESTKNILPMSFYKK